MLMRLKLMCVLMPVVLFGFLSKHYEGPGAGWVNGYAGGVLYEIFWVLLILMVRRPVENPAWTALSVFSITSWIECLQLWKPAWLVSLRSTFWGGVLLGSDFSWLDFPHYALGCWMACGLYYWVNDEALKRRLRD